MRIEEMREIIFDVVSRFFANATVIWAEQSITQPRLPYVTLKIMDIGREAFSVTDKDGCTSYHYNTTMDVNLHTNGMEMVSGDGMTTNYQNTATQDMIDFANYVESEGVTNILADAGIEISLIPPVRDLTELQNDTMYQYRSMAEFAITFASEVTGLYGIGTMTPVPNSSGGGLVSLAEADAGYFEEVEIIEGGAE